MQEHVIMILNGPKVTNLCIDKESEIWENKILYKYIFIVFHISPVGKQVFLMSRKNVNTNNIKLSKNFQLAISSKNKIDPASFCSVRNFWSDLWSLGFIPGMQELELRGCNRSTFKRCKKLSKLRTSFWCFHD